MAVFSDAVLYYRCVHFGGMTSSVCVECSLKHQSVDQSQNYIVRPNINLLHDYCVGRNFLLFEELLIFAVSVVTCSTFSSRPGSIQKLAPKSARGDGESIR